MPRRMIAWVGKTGDVLAGEADAARARACGLPQIVISRVDLPAPLAPIRVTISPSLDRQIDAVQRLDRAVEGMHAAMQHGTPSPSSTPLADARPLGLAEIGLDHGGIAADLGRRAVGDLACRNRARRRGRKCPSRRSCRARSAGSPTPCSVADRQQQPVELRDSRGLRPAAGSSRQSSTGSVHMARAISRRRCAP